LIESGVRSFEPCAQGVRSAMEAWIGALRRVFGTSKCGVKVIERDEALSKVLGLEERLVILEAGEDSAGIMTEFDGAIGRRCEC